MASQTPAILPESLVYLIIYVIINITIVLLVWCIDFPIMSLIIVQPLFCFRRVIFKVCGPYALYLLTFAVRIWSICTDHFRVTVVYIKTDGDVHLPSALFSLPLLHHSRTFPVC